MIIALFANLKKPLTLKMAQEVRAFFKERGVDVVAREEMMEQLQCESLEKCTQKIDFLLALGGDGTILRVVHHFPHLNAPIVGINMGHLGFMTEITLADVKASLNELLQGAYRVEERIMLQATLKGHVAHAVNDVVIHRGKNPSLIDLSISVDGKYLNTFSADGIIFSTPNGSTAYSLAAGGPIVSPELNAFLITPICPHTISNRPLVLMPQENIEIQHLSKNLALEVSYDGFSLEEMPPNAICTLQKSSRHFKMVSLHRNDYFSTLRTKLAWSGQVRHHQLHSIEEE